mmetsp:Transcript_63224/g.193399  ORF Transcript_63224/g.193399 Transcript_63224/m.193399 type:complete len:94 (+) Transcript_63224:187-468(+)
MLVTAQTKTNLTIPSAEVLREPPSDLPTDTLASMSLGKSNDIGKYRATHQAKQHPYNKNPRNIISSLATAVGIDPLALATSLVIEDATAGPAV